MATTQNYYKIKHGLEAPSQDAIQVTDSTFPKVRPTLSLDFANSKSVDERITFTRSTNATYYDSNGILRTVYADQPRIDFDPATGECKGLLIEEQRTNLFRYSNNMSIGGGSDMWLSQLSGATASYVTNFGMAPDGTMTSSRLRADGGRLVAQAVAGYYSTGTGNYTFSLWIKCTAGGGSLSVWSGTSGGVGGSVTFGANGVWTRYSCGVAVTGNNDISISISSTGTVLEFWAPQYEAGTFATSYIPSTTTFTSRASSATYYDSTGVLRIAGTNQPRYGYGYDTATGKWVSQGLVLEAAATNLLSNSEHTPFGVSYSTDGTTTLFSSQEATPYGTIGTWGFTANQGYCYRNVQTIGASDFVCYSVFVKPNSTSTATINIYYINLFTGPSATLNFSTGVVTTTGPNIHSAGAVFVGNNTWRMWIVSTPPGSSTGHTINVPANGTKFWGLQVENNIYYPTSYIPTLASTATRAADVSTSVATTRVVDEAFINNITPWYNAIESTLYGEGYSFTGNAVVATNPGLVQLDDGTNANRYAIRRFNNAIAFDAGNSGLTFRLTSVINGVTINLDAFPLTSALPVEWDDANKHKAAFAIKANTQAAYADGLNAQLTSIPAAPYSTPTRMAIGSCIGAAPWNGHISKVAYYSKFLTNAEMQGLTK